MASSGRSKVDTMLDLVSRAVPIKVAYRAAEMSEHEYRVWRSDPVNVEILEQAKAKAEARLFQQQLSLGQGDWKCISQVLERSNPQEFAKPEVQAQLSDQAMDAKQVGMEIMKFLAAAEERHSGDAEVVKDAIIVGGDSPAVPTETKSIEVEVENPYDDGLSDEE